MEPINSLATIIKTEEDKDLEEVNLRSIPEDRSTALYARFVFGQLDVLNTSASVRGLSLRHQATLLGQSIQPKPLMASVTKHEGELVRTAASQSSLPPRTRFAERQLANLRSQRESFLFKTKIIANGVEVASIVPDTVMAAIVATVHAGCNSHPQAQKMCHATAELAKKTYRAANAIVPQPVKVYAAQAGMAVKSGVKWYLDSDLIMDKRLGIPVAQTKEHHKHLGMILSFGANRLLPLKKVKTQGEWVKTFEEIGYKIVKGGKGSHVKMVKPDSPMVIISKEIDKVIPSTLKRIYLAQTGGASSKVKSSLPQLAHYHVPAHRFDYSHKFQYHWEEAFHKPKLFDGVLSRELYVVRFNNYTTNYKWFMPVIEANKHPTQKLLKDALALLDSFAELTQVTLAKIPAGERVRFIHGRASPQVDGKEFRPGGGVQYRFFDFDPKWIVSVKDLPK